MTAKVVDIMTGEKLAERAAELGDWAMDRFRKIGEKVPGSIAEVRGKGLIIGIVLSFPGKEVWQELIDRGFICNLTQDVVIRLLPALTIDKADLEAFAQALEEILRKHKP